VWGDVGTLDEPSKEPYIDPYKRIENVNRNRWLSEIFASKEPYIQPSKNSDWTGEFRRLIGALLYRLVVASNGR